MNLNSVAVRISCIRLIRLVINIDEQTTKTNGYYNLRDGILEELKTFKRRLEFESRKFATAKTELNPDFPHESELIKKQARLSELNQKLSA